MLRLGLALLLCTMAAAPQTKKILVAADPALVKEFESASPRARLVPVTPATITKEIAEAYAVIGEIKPEHVRAAKKLQWVQVMAAGVARVLHLSGGNNLRDSPIVLTNNQMVQGPRSPTMRWPCCCPFPAASPNSL